MSAIIKRLARPWFLILKRLYEEVIIIKQLFEVNFFIFEISDTWANLSFSVNCHFAAKMNF
jgi:hypothetical protein